MAKSEALRSLRSGPGAGHGELHKADLNRPANLGGYLLFSDMAPADLDAMLLRAQEHAFTRRQSLFHRGQKAVEVYLLLSGCVKLTQMGGKGNEVILRLAGAGDVLGAANIHTGLYSAGASALESCRALSWESEEFEDFAMRMPLLRRNLMRILAGDLHELEQRFQELSTKRVANRVANEIVRSSLRVGRPVEGGVLISLSREELGQMTGTTMFTVSRLLSEWETKGWISALRSALVLCDSESLSAIAAAEPSMNSLAAVVGEP